MRRSLWIILISLLMFIGCKSGSKEEKELESRPFPSADVTIPSEGISSPQGGQGASKKEESSHKEHIQQEHMKKKNIVTKKPALEEKIPPPSPEIRYISHTIEDGNKNGMIEPGEMVIIYINVKNMGKGVAENEWMKVNPDESLMVGIEEIALPEIQPGETKSIPVKLFVRGTASPRASVKFVFSSGEEVEIPVAITIKQKSEEEMRIMKKKMEMDEKREKAFDELDEELGE